MWIHPTTKKNKVKNPYGTYYDNTNLPLNLDLVESYGRLGDTIYFYRADDNSHTRWTFETEEESILNEQRLHIITSREFNSILEESVKT